MNDEKEKLDVFALVALNGMLSGANVGTNLAPVEAQAYARSAYAMARAMLEESQKQQP